MLHFAMGWNYSAHVSFRNGLVLLRPCFVLLVLDWTFVSLFNVVLVLDSIFLSLVLLVLDGTFVSLFNVVLACSTRFFILGDWILQPIYRGIGFSNPF